MFAGAGSLWSDFQGAHNSSQFPCVRGRSNDTQTGLQPELQSHQNLLDAEMCAKKKNPKSRLREVDFISLGQSRCFPHDVGHQNRTE